MSSPTQPDNTTALPTGRTLILCFDGTDSLYDEKNSNVVKFFALLDKSQMDKQILYYQTGIGTYINPAIYTPALNFFAKLADQAVAWYLDAHVLGGYQFLMQNYRSTADKICLFGFSRGAYTARALAGMLTKVGLIPPNMPEQIMFAYKMYKDTSKKNAALSRGFKKTFSRSVPIEFIGVWETVSSVGTLYSRHLPFTYSNSIIRTFRHALALDEHRARFQPNMWHRGEQSAADSSTVDGAKDEEREERKEAQEDGGVDDGFHAGRATDVREVWFVGCHSDIGGGETPSSSPTSLANIPLKWMVRECIASQSGILFDWKAMESAGIQVDVPFGVGVDGGGGESAGGDGGQHTLSKFGFTSTTNASNTATATNQDQQDPKPTKAQNSLPASASPSPSKSTSTSASGPGPLPSTTSQDSLAPIHDHLRKNPLWWALEFSPIINSFEDGKGKWHVMPMVNLFRRRKIHGDVLLHESVLLRQNETRARKNGRGGYKPRAKWTGTARVVGHCGERNGMV